MKARRVRPLLLSMPVLLALGVTSAFAGVKDCVTYVERQDRPKQDPQGRSIRAGEGRIGIDINSTLEIRYDEASLAREVATNLEPARADERIARLIGQIESLGAAAKILKSATEASKRVVDVFKNPAVSREDYETALRDMAKQAMEILVALTEAHQARLEFLGLQPEEVRVETRAFSNSIRKKVLTEGQGYDFAKVMPDVAQEIRDMDDSIARLTADVQKRDQASGLSLELRAYILRRGGGEAPLYLPGHNEVKRGRADRYRKLQYEMSDQERQAYQKAEDVAKEIGESKNLAEAVRASLRASFGTQIGELKGPLGALRDAADKAKGKVTTVAQWEDKARLKEWVTTVDTRGAVPPRVETALEEFRAAVHDIGSDFDQISGLADLKWVPDEKSPLAAYDAVTSKVHAVERLTNPETWKSRLLAGKNLMDAVESTDRTRTLAVVEGPVKAWKDAKESLSTVKDAAEAVHARLTNLTDLSKQSDLLVSVAGLPEPAGQRRRPLTEDVDTSVDLQSIEGGRQEGDQIVVSHRMLAGDRQIAGWEDHFTIEVYGWQSRAIAGLAFARQDVASGGTTWKPTADVSWIVTHKRWAKPCRGGGTTCANGLRGAAKMGVGLSVVSLDTVDDQDIELGVAPTLSFLDDFVQVGYGWNLQAPSGDEHFLFFSIRAFRSASMFEGAGKK